jgi:uncharacterized protein (TIGR02118 family)
MIRVSVLYPQGGKFDEQYYVNNHLKLIADKCGAALLKAEMDKGVAGATPGSPAPFVAIGHLYFNSVPEFISAFAPAAGEIMSDVPNYTDGQPQIQISEIIEAKGSLNSPSPTH